MRMLILAGGLGTRLRGVVSNVPKPLAPIGTIPFLHYQIENWLAQGVQSFIFLVHHQSKVINRFIDERRGSLFTGCTVQSIVEPHPLDTGGAVGFAVRQLGLEGQLLITNADTWLGAGVRELAITGANSLVVVQQADASRYGRVEVDETGCVRSFLEKTDRSESGWINAGMYALGAEIFSEWNGQRMSLEMDVFPKLLAERRLRAVPMESDFIDIGVPEDYFRFCRWQKGGRKGKLCN